MFSIVIVAGAFLASPLGILFTDEQQADNTVPLATAIAEIQGEYHAELERLQNGDFVSVQIVGQAPDWREVVAVFASKTAGAEDGIDVFTLDEERVELLRQVFWDMCEITTATQTVDVPDSDPDDDVDDSHTGIALTITITAKTAEQMRLIYAFTKYQNDALDILLENLGSLNIPMGSLTISQEDAIALLENLPDDLDPARKAVVETAVQRRSQRRAAAPPARCARSDWIAAVSSIGRSTMRRTAATIRGTAVVRPHSTAIAPTSHGTTRSRAIWCSIPTIRTSALSAVRMQTEIS